MARLTGWLWRRGRTRASRQDGPSGAPPTGKHDATPPDRREDPFDVDRLARQFVRVYTDRDGLPMNSVTALAFDADGYLWAGTQDGAAYYNGRVWRVVPLPDRLRSDWVASLAVGPDGSVWFGTPSGLACLDGGEWRAFDASSGLPHDRVPSLAVSVARDGSWGLLAGTLGGVARLEAGRWSVFDAASGMPSDRVSCVLESRDRSALWVGTYAGLATLEGDRWTLLDASSGLPDDTVLSLLEGHAEDGARELWVGTSRGLGRVGAASWGPPDLPDDAVQCLAESRSGERRVWAGTRSGLVKLERDRSTSYGTASGLPGNVLLSLLAGEGPGRDDSRLLWAGTEGAGLAKIERGMWRTLDVSSGLPTNMIYSLAEGRADDGSPVLWVGTMAGLARLGRGEWSVLDSSSGLPGDVVFCLLASSGVDGAPVLWVGTDAGLARLERGAWTTFTVASGLPNDDVICLLETEGDEGHRVLYVGTAGGLARYERGAWTVYDKSSGLPSNLVLCMLETRAEGGSRTLWVGTNAGLARLERGAWSVYNAASGLPADLVYCLRECQDGGERRLWIGTNGGGLARMRLSAPGAPLDVLSQRSEPALPNDCVYQICRDRRGRFYLPTNKGVARLTPRRPSPSDPSELTVETFTTEHGLPNNECNQGVSMVDGLGRIWVGTVAGAAIFDPDEEVEDRSPKPLVVERVLVNGSPRALEPRATLDYDEHDLAFEVTLLSYVREAETRYRTQLVGYDDAPSGWTADWKRTYTNLPAGSYRFRAWGRDASGNVSGPVELEFRIKPAPWKTWWAYALYGAAAAGAGYAGLRYRVDSLKRRSDELEALVARRTAELAESERRAVEAKEEALEASKAKSVFLANMSHELRTPLNAVIGFSQLMERSRDIGAGDRENLAIIQRSGEHLLGLINDVLSIAKIEAGKLALTERPYDLARLLHAVRGIVGVRAEPKGLELALEADPSVARVVMGDEGKLRQVLINLLGNAVKFTERGRVTLRARWADGRAAFEVEDTGQGISEEELEGLFEPFAQTAAGRAAKEGTGLGLTISRQVVELMGGDIRVRSRVGVGTTFSFEVDAPEAEGGAEAERRRVLGLAAGEAPRRILVVDDTEENRVLLVKLLEATGFEVCEAVNGLQAIEAWERWDPHLIFMDMRMPVMDGREASQRIRKAEASRGDGSHVTIVALTASAFEHERDDILASGADAFATKPFQEEALFERIASTLGVRFRYEEEQEARSTPGVWSLGTPERLGALPPELLGGLYEELTNGNRTAALAFAERIATVDEVLGRELISEVRAYRFDELMTLIEASGVLE